MRNLSVRLVGLLLVLLLAACASIEKADGEQLVASRLRVQLSESWNKLPGVDGQPFQSWTQEGMPIDQLRFWAGLKPDQALIRAVSRAAPAGGAAPRVPTFTKGMSLDQLVNLFEVAYSADGSSFTLTKAEPVTFVGEKGVRFEFSLVRKSDELQMRGVGWAAVHKDQLFAINYVAPRLSFFARLVPKAEAVAAGASIKD